MREESEGLRWKVVGKGETDRHRVEFASREACKRGLLAWMCLASSVPRDSQS